LPDAATMLSIAANTATVLAAIIVPFALGLRRRYQRTIGSRRKLVGQIDKLSCNVQTAYVDGLLGPPLFVRKSDNATERVYLTPHAYVQIVADDGDSVVWWAVTTTDKHFKPRFYLPPMSLDDTGWRVQLNKSSFTDLASSPLGVRWEVGARRFRVVESYYFGNPGHYQRYLVAYNDAGVGAVHVDDKRPPINYGDLMSRPEESMTPNDQPILEDYASTFRADRGGTVVNSFGVMRPSAGDAETELLRQWGLGPDLDYIRVLNSTAATLPSWWRINRNPLFPWRMRRQWQRMRREAAHTR
jgi:hypothetical protein